MLSAWGYSYIQSTRGDDGALKLSYEPVEARLVCDIGSITKPPTFAN